MTRWKPIDSAPEGRSILVDGGTVMPEVGDNYPVTEPVKVQRTGNRFDCVETSAYSVIVADPLFWTELPVRPLSLALPPPQGFDL